MANMELVKAGTVARQELGASQTQELAERASAAVAARERAAIEARYIMAERHARDTEGFRLALEKECQRPSFAAVAIYRKPVGKKWNRETGKEEEQFIEGPSIRFVETALRCYRNVYPEVVTVFDSPDVRICRVSVTDLESNLTYTTEVTISKTVERKGKQVKGGEWEPPRGRELVGEGRPNSYGDMTYPVRATDDEVLIKQNALLSKAIRTNGQRLLPGDIVEQCVKIIRQTQADRDRKDPDAAKRQVLDAFSEVDVTPADIQAWLGHSMDRIQPAELANLRGIYSAIKNGEATWEEVMDARSPAGSAEAAEAVAQKRIADLKAQQATKDSAKQQGAAAPADADNASTDQSPEAETKKPPVPDVEELPDPAEAREGQQAYYKNNLCTFHEGQWTHEEPKKAEPATAARPRFGRR
jgi:hypothetical protein